MLEIPESKTIARQMQETVKGKRIKSCVAGASPHGFAFYHGDPAGYGELLGGRSIDEVTSFAGYVEAKLGDVRLQFNDGVNVRYLEPGAAAPKKHQLYLEFDDGSIIYCTISMYAGLMAFREGALDDNFYHKAAHEKPSPLSDAFTPAYFDGILAEAKPTLSAKALLATEQRIPGLGNGVLQDILFRAGVHPKKQLKAMSDGDKEAMYRSVRQTLQDMTDGGGRDTEKYLFGKNGGYVTALSKNTLAYPCRQCGDSLVKHAYLGGAIYFCPTCQPL